MNTLDEILATAHNLKSPLLAIERLSERLLEDEDSLSERSRRKLELIYESALKASGYMEGLDLSCERTLQEGGSTTSVNLAELAREVVENCKGTAESKAQTLHFAVSHSESVEDCVVFGDPSQLRKAMSNLVDNALKYSPEGDTVEVWVGRFGGQVAFSVTDNGPGLTPGDQDRLFEPFEQGSAIPTGGESSSGLGLYLVEQILRRHDGTVEVDSEEGEGSTFTLLFPSASPESSSSTTASDSQPEAADASTTRTVA
jgi:signal transduction histidine kinase